MIKPHKYLDVDTCVLKIASQILSILNEIGLIKYDELFKKIIGNNKNAKYNIIPAVDLLYLLGKIKYNKDLDSLELIL